MSAGQDHRVQDFREVLLLMEHYLQTHRQLDTDDLDEAREHVGKLWERHQSHLQRGRTYGLQWHQVNLRRTSLSYVNSASAIHVSCGPVSGRLRLTMPEEGRVAHYIDGKRVEGTPDHGVLYTPGRDLKLDIKPYRSLLLAIDEDFVARAARRRFDRVPDASDWPNRLPLDLPSAATLRSLCRWLGQELDRPGTPLLTSPRVIDGFERSVLTLFLECLAARPQFQQGRRPGDLSAAHLRRIEEWLDVNFLESIGVEDMAHVANISVRAVQTLFRRLRDCTPSEALMARRLDHAKHVLEEAAADTTVTTVAYDCGFFHLSRFAARYAERFGERPSQTLAKRLRKR